MKYFKEFSDAWQEAMKETGTDAFKTFGESWQNSLLAPGMGQLEAYGDSMKKFAETWTSMWPTK